LPLEDEYPLTKIYVTRSLTGTVSCEKRLLNWHALSSFPPKQLKDVEDKGHPLPIKIIVS
jgi:hypothetical protein